MHPLIEIVCAEIKTVLSCFNNSFHVLNYSGFVCGYMNILNGMVSTKNASINFNYIRDRNKHI